MSELVTIMANLAAAVQTGELTNQEAVDLLDAFQDHEFEAAAEGVFIVMDAARLHRYEMTKG